MIERSIHNWMTTVNPAVKVVKAPFEGTRPDSPYLTYQVISIVPEADRYKETVNPAGDAVTYIGSAAMRVSVNAYSPLGHSLLTRLHQSRRDFESRLALLSDDEDISCLGTQNIQTLTALGDESWRSRFQADFNFLVGIKNEFAFQRITQWSITGQFSNEDDSQIITGSAGFTLP